MGEASGGVDLVAMPELWELLWSLVHTAFMGVLRLF